MTRDELIHEIGKLDRQISRQLNYIEGVVGSGTPFSSKMKYADVQEKYTQNVDEMDIKELRNYYRDLQYINDLRTLSIQGVRNEIDVMQPLLEKLETLSKEKQREFWNIYGRLYDTLSTLSRFKYDIFNVAIDEIMQGQNIDDIYSKLISEYDKIIEDVEQNKNIRNKEKSIKIRYTKRLRKML